jgi:phosphocarrier protein
MSETVKATVEIINTRGLHARAAAKLVKLVETFEAEITISKDDMTVIGESIMGLLMLGASKGTFIIIEAKGPDAADGLTQITGLVENKFEEDH